MKNNIFLLLLCSCFLLCTNFLLLPKKTKVYGFNKIEKNWTPINENVLANKFEVTNIEYQVFLNSISKDVMWTGKKERLEVHNENWSMLDNDLSDSKENNSNSVFSKQYHTNPSFHYYPVVNITQEGAKAFCEWLTTAYNNKPNRKYKKINIRLPAEQEWILAARAGHEHAPFPWGGYYVRNGNGEFLANFRRIDESNIKQDRKTGKIEMANEDLGSSSIVFPSPVNAYFSNDLGLFNTSGNVAEMLVETGRTKGGSWASSGYYIRIDAEDEYAGFQEASPFIGFRYFVDIIEE